MSYRPSTQRIEDQAARLKVRAPSQARGQETLERIVAATQRLLRTRRFEDITISQIVAEADTSTGSFYARFASKDALLPYLYEAYNANTAVATEDLGGQVALKAARTLRQAVSALIEQLREGPVRMDQLVRTMALYARSHPERLPESAYTRSKRFFDIVSTVLRPHMKPAPDAHRRAQFAVFAAATLLREHGFFSDAPLAKALGFTHEEFAAEVERMTTAYLEGAA
jgi:AcrR family transcriptional regulator